MRRKMKEKLRQAWRDPGYKNSEFNPIHPLRPKVLSEWELIRCLMPERSYKYYPDRPHIKISHNIEEFDDPPRKGLSEKYIQYLEGHEKRFTDFALRPSKYGGEIKAQVLLDKINVDCKKDPFKLPGTAPGQEFGFPRYTSSSNTMKSTNKNIRGVSLGSKGIATDSTALPTIKNTDSDTLKFKRRGQETPTNE
jgi:hypothetical protein